MQKLYLFILLLGLAFTSAAQNTPNNSARPAAAAATVPGSYTNTTINYIRTWEPNMPTADPAAVAAATDVSAVKQTTQYFDGLGRPVQTVKKGISPSGKDMVAPVLYDAYGREQLKYLPYIPQAGNMSDGKFKTDPFNAQKTFYQTPALAPGAVGESIYYSQIEYEASPLNRVLKTYAPGNTWAKEGGNKPVEQQYQFNTTADGIRIWDITTTGAIPTSASGRTYAATQLYKSVTRDERGKRVVNFKDKEDRLLMKRIELVDGAGDGHDGWLCTYYIYDELGNLRVVIPPKAVDLIKGTWVISQAILDELCFQYKYDSRNRMITKKVPGAAQIEMVYDVRDRVVFTSDGNLRNTSQAGGAKWLVTFYDQLNRPTMTALYNSASTRDALQISMNTATTNTQSIPYTFPGMADLQTAYYDGRAKYEATNSISFESGFETGAGTEMLAEIITGLDQGTVTIVASNPLPNITPSALTPLSYTFYDDYNFPGKHDPATADFTAPQYTGSSYAEVVTSVSNKTKGIVTGSKVRVLGTDQWLTTTTYYTDKDRPLQNISDNVNGGKDILTNMYDFSGRQLSTFLRHVNPRSGTTPQSTVMTQLLYDKAGRITQVIKQLNGDIKRTIAQSSYDELGQLKTKRLHVTGTDTQLETLNYGYNIRGWLKSINKDFLNSPNSTANWFGQELSYDYGFGVNQVNGNIAGEVWKSGGDDVSRAYGYSYDNVSRLTTADFTQKNTSSATMWEQNVKNFSVSGLTYDANGNITAMARKGMIGTGITTIDQLTYTYLSNSNKLASVADPSNTASAKLGDFINGTNTGDDFTYDANGNITKDLNKNIAGITYNHLNLPENITIAGKGTIKYLYDATGNKLRKVVVDNTQTTARTITTDYSRGFVYRNDTLQFITHEEGRIRPVFKAGQPVAFYYDYFIKDYLGNVRSILTEQSDLTMYTATMEADNAATETALFSNVETTRSAKPAGYPEDQTTRKNDYVAKLNAREGGKKIGPSLVLKVMAGDTLQIGARAFYKSVGPKNNKTATPEDMVAGLLQAFGGESLSGSSHASRQSGGLSPFGNFKANDYQRLKERDPDQNQQDRPKAYISFVLFDDQFNLVDENSGVRQVKNEPDQLQTLSVDKMRVKKNGFLYVYTSNETTQDLLFDDLTVMASSGPLLEETHYYPYGLTISNISSNALQGTNYTENRMKFGDKEMQEKEFADGSGLELYDFGARFYDAQLGRWHSIDPKSEASPALTPFRYGYNNPVRFIDANGKYETDGHFWTVYLMATLMGRGDAYSLAYHTEAPDNLMGRNGEVMSSPSTWLEPDMQKHVHALTGGDPVNERVVSGLYVRSAQSVQQLGWALHRLGDSYAHTNMHNSGVMYVQGVGHGLDLHAPDKIMNRPGLYLQYVQQLKEELGTRLGYKGKIDTYTFDYVAKSGGNTEQNMAVFETEVRIREGAGSFTVYGDRVPEIKAYIRASNEHFGRSVNATVVTTLVDMYKKNEKGEWVKDRTEPRTVVKFN